MTYAIVHDPAFEPAIWQMTADAFGGDPIWKRAFSEFGETPDEETNSLALWSQIAPYAEVISER
jgi:hypothetical protein